MDRVQDVTSIARVTRRTDAGQLAEAAYNSFIALADDLTPQEWKTPTECSEWTVDDMVGHVIGAAKSCASIREMVRQQRWGLKHRREHADNPLDAVNALQVAEHAELSPAEKVRVLRQIAPRAVTGRLRMPRLVRAVNVPLASTGSTALGMPDRLNLGHLVDVVYTRDVWMHTIDIARAVGRSPDLSGAHHARLIADIVAEWVDRHQQPVDLMLTGPAGGHFRYGREPERMELDAVEFCRVLSGRAPGSGLLGTRVIF